MDFIGCEATFVCFSTSIDENLLSSRVSLVLFLIILVLIPSTAFVRVTAEARPSSSLVCNEFDLNE